MELFMNKRLHQGPVSSVDPIRGLHLPTACVYYMYFLPLAQEMEVSLVNSSGAGSSIRLFRYVSATISQLGKATNMN